MRYKLGWIWHRFWYDLHRARQEYSWHRMTMEDAWAVIQAPLDKSGMYGGVVYESQQRRMRRPRRREAR